MQTKKQLREDLHIRHQEKVNRGVQDGGEKTSKSKEVSIVPPRQDKPVDEEEKLGSTKRARRRRHGIKGTRPLLVVFSAGNLQKLRLKHGQLLSFLRR